MRLRAKSVNQKSVLARAAKTGVGAQFRMSLNARRVNECPEL